MYVVIYDGVVCAMGSTREAAQSYIGQAGAPGPFKIEGPFSQLVFPPDTEALWREVKREVGYGAAAG